MLVASRHVPESTDPTVSGRLDIPGAVAGVIGLAAATYALIEGPSGKVTMDPKTHHTIRNAYLARPKDRVWELLQTFPNQFPSDTGGACDLIKSPRTNKQFMPQV